MSGKENTPGGQSPDHVSLLWPWLDEESSESEPQLEEESSLSTLVAQSDNDAQTFEKSALSK
jgi:hypothetical protein